MALTDLLIRKALPSQKPCKMGDDRGNVMRLADY